jgi:serine/threonine-protein kinase HipA
LDYEDLIKASSLLCQSPRAGQMQFRRAMFNLFACNQDDHSKNWAFLQNDNGQWQLAPFYDVTFSPSPYGEHATAFGGYGKQPPLKVIQQIANHANFANWKEAQFAIAEIVESINQFALVARELGVSNETITLITQQLNQVHQDNKGLL